MEDSITLAGLAVGESATVLSLTAAGSIRRRLLDIGLIAGAEVTCIGRSPCGDPAAYLIKGAVIAIRAIDARSVCVRRRPASEKT